MMRKQYTARVPPQKCKNEDLQKLKERYAQTLMQPVETIQEHTQEMKPVSQEPTRKRRLQIG